MSAKSSNKTHRQLGRIARSSNASPRKRNYKWQMLILLPLWVLAAFYATQLIVLGILWVLELVHMPIESLVSPAVAQTGIAAVVYALTVAVVIGVPYAIWRQKISLTTLGIARLPSWTDIGLAPLGFIIYGILTTIVLMIVTAVFAGFPADQAQDVGFQFGSRIDNLLAFVTLVVIAPIAEELLFRGYLYGKLKGYVPSVAAAIFTSLLFGIVHGQLNVGVDVFLLSLVLCGLRSLTGSIWAGVLVHMIKNAIAYYLLFINPLLGG